MKRKRRGRRGQKQNQPVRHDGADRISIRVVDLLDAYSGTRQIDGTPILMATVAHYDNVETLAFTVRDTKRLAIHALVALSGFGVRLAKHIVEQHFVGESDISLGQMDERFD